jgi:cation/acetate symporter
MGWTGGYCLVALFLAPYLRKFGQFTIPDFLGARYEGNAARLVGILIAILCSFTYVVAQIYGVGLITTRLSGLAVRDRHLRRPRRHPGVLVPGRHACGDLDAGGAVHHPDHCLHDPGGVAVGEADRRAGAAGRLRLPAAEGHAKEKQLIDDPKEKEVIAIFKKQSDAWPPS